MPTAKLRQSLINSFSVFLCGHKHTDRLTLTNTHILTDEHTLLNAVPASQCIAVTQSHTIIQEHKYLE